jgi:hypothetical protein
VALASSVRNDDFRLMRGLAGEVRRPGIGTTKA